MEAKAQLPEADFQKLASNCIGRGQTSFGHLSISVWSNAASIVNR